MLKTLVFRYCAPYLFAVPLPTNSNVKIMGLLKKLFTNCACPQGRMGRAMLKFMNLCHAPLTNWFVSPHALTSRVVWHVTEKGWSSDFPPLPSAFSSNSLMAFMLRSHNGVHCCGTVGDSHSSSQLSTAKCTFTGDSFQNHDAKIQSFFERTDLNSVPLAKIIVSANVTSPS